MKSEGKKRKKIRENCNNVVFHKTEKRKVNDKIERLRIQSKGKLRAEYYCKHGKTFNILRSKEKE